MITEADRYSLAGRLEGYLKNYEDAVRILSEGLEKFPDDAPLLRHRGHRYITLRRFDEAIADFERAAELVEGKPDELEYYLNPMKQDIIALILGRDDQVTDQHQLVTPESIEATKHLYKSTLKSSIFYHWALARYLQGDFEIALGIYRRALEVAVDNDMRVATSDWTYMTLRRLGRDEEAAEVLASIDPADSVVVEPSYMRRWRMYRGELQPEDLLDPDIDDKRSLATQGYGVGNWYLYSGQTDKAMDVFKRVLAAGSSDAFGFIASEVELARAEVGAG